MKVIIDRSKWRCGGSGPNINGKGSTRLLNKQNFMCCLGFHSLAAGMSEEEILERDSPTSLVGNLSTERKLYLAGLINNPEYSGRDSLFAKSAIKINDDRDLTNEEREKALAELAKEHGHEYVFVGEYQE